MTVDNAFRALQRVMHQMAYAMHLPIRLLSRYGCYPWRIAQREYVLTACMILMFKSLGNVKIVLHLLKALCVFGYSLKSFPNILGFRMPGKSTNDLDYDFLL